MKAAVCCNGSFRIIGSVSCPITGRMALHNASDLVAFPPTFPGRAVKTRLFVRNNFQVPFSVLSMSGALS